jgi:sugar phosphate isomerase/epimerase
MRIGICTNLADAPAAKAAGFDYLEASVQELLAGTVPDEDWDGPGRKEKAEMEVPSGNLLVPPSLKITGPDADLGKLQSYMATVLCRAATLGMKTLVFGSGGARAVPEGFDPEKAKRQIIDFAREIAPLAQLHGVMIVLEPLSRKDCNIINSVAEAMEIVRAVAHPNFQCLVDSYHFWTENEPLENLRLAMPWIRHVHVADRQGRVAPGESGESDYRPFFAVLKQGGYNGNVSVEANFPHIAEAGPRVLEFIKKQWKDA